MLVRQRNLVVAVAVLLLSGASRATIVKPDRPLRGWNSYDAFGSSDENVTLTTAQAMQKSSLILAGYNYVTIDAGWFGHGTTYIDSFGRPIPDPMQYPSTKSGSTFKPVADAVHAMGLKFGLWYMAGVPHQSVEAKSPIKGTNYTVADIVTTNTYCPRWDRGWGFEVDPDHPGTKAWYDSLVELWTEWNIDLIKLDCVNAEDEAWTHRMDIVHLSNSFEKSPQPFVFSLSPGGFSNVSQILDIRPYVTMARATDDFWDDWDKYMNQGGGGGWSSGYSRWDAARDLVSTVRSSDPTYWIDLDMLPFGRIGHAGSSCTPTGPGCPRQSRYTADESKAIMTLWTLTQSPLILGSDLTVDFSEVEKLVTHGPVLDMTEDISNAWESLRRNTTSEGFIAWQAESSHTPSKRYVALFNLWNTTQDVQVSWDHLGFSTAPSQVTDLWTGANHSTNGASLQAKLNSHAVLLVAAWT